MAKTLMGYILGLEDIVKDLNEMIADLEGNTVLQTERETLRSAKDRVWAVLHSFKRLKGIK